MGTKHHQTCNINADRLPMDAIRPASVTLNAAEREVIALCAATQEAVYLRKLANELGFTQTSPTPMYEDCTAAVALSKENRFRNRSKHIELRWSYISERQNPDIGDIQVISVSRKIMLADIFASPRPAFSFLPFRDTILGGANRSARTSPSDERGPHPSNAHATKEDAPNRIGSALIPSPTSALKRK